MGHSATTSGGSGLLTLTDDDIKFLREMAHELKTQDNRATGAPYYYTVRIFKEVTGMDWRYSDDTVYVRLDGNDPEEYETEEAALKQLVEEGYTPEEAQEHFDNHYEKFGKFEYREDHNVFLTYKGYLEHMRLNAHNYPGKKDGDRYTAEDDKRSNLVYSYVQHAFRNPEMARLIEILKKFGD